MPNPSTTPATTTAKTPLEVAEQLIVDLRQKLLETKADLDAERATSVGKALHMPFKGLPKDYNESIIMALNCRLSQDQAIRMRALFNGLEARNVKLADGKPVWLPHHAILWVIENLTFDGKPA